MSETQNDLDQLTDYMRIRQLEADLTEATARAERVEAALVQLNLENERAAQGLAAAIRDRDAYKAALEKIARQGYSHRGFTEEGLIASNALFKPEVQA